MPAVSAEEVRSAAAGRPDQSAAGRALDGWRSVPQRLLLIAGGTVAVRGDAQHGREHACPSDTLISPEHRSGRAPIPRRPTPASQRPSCQRRPQPPPTASAGAATTSVAPAAPLGPGAHRCRGPTRPARRVAQPPGLHRPRCETVQFLGGKNDRRGHIVVRCSRTVRTTPNPAPGLFESYDPSTRTRARRVPTTRTGGISYSQPATVGGGPNFHPLPHLRPDRGRDGPAAWSPEQVVEIVRTRRKTRLAESPTTSEVLMPDDSFATTMVTRDIIDPTTGLHVARSLTSTDAADSVDRGPHDQPRRDRP